MAFAILFCLLLDHQVVAGVMEQRLLRSEVSTTRVGPSESSFNKTPETKHSTRNLPINDSNKLVADHSAQTNARGRICLTEVGETIGTFISRQLAALKQTGSELKESRLLKKTIRRNLMRSAIERKIAYKISALSTRYKASAADRTKRISLMKIETEAVYPRKVSFSKHTRPNRKLSSESRHVHSAVDYFGYELISTYLKSNSNAEGMEPKRLAKDATGYRSPQMVPNLGAPRKDEAWDYQALETKVKSPSDTHSVFLDESVEMKKDETGFLHNLLNKESSNMEVETEKKSKRVKREKYTTTPGTDSASARPSGGLAVVFGAEPNAAAAPTVTAGLALSEMLAREKVVAEMPVHAYEPKEPAAHFDTTTAYSNSSVSSGVVFGVLGGMALGAVLATVAIVIYLNLKKKPTDEMAGKGEKEPLKPGGTKSAAAGIATQDLKSVLKTSASKAAAKTKDVAMDAAKTPAAPPPPNAAAATTPAKPK